MKIAFLVFGAMALLIGCAGGGGSTLSTSGLTSTSGGSTSTSGGSTTSTGGSTTSGDFAVIPSNTPGEFDVNVLTGMGRAATVSVDIDQIAFDRVSGSPLTSSFPPVRIGLDGYTHDVLTASTSLSPASQEFDGFTFRISKLILPGNIEVNGPVSTSAPLTARTGRGRVVTMRLLLDDSMVYEDNGSITVDPMLFEAANTQPYNGALACFYSDFVRFDISGVAQAPAKYLYMSGDLYATSEDAPSTFEAFFGIGRNLDTVAQRSGSFSGVGSGAYQLDETDPNDPNSTLKRLEGTWTDTSNVLENVGAFAMIAFPSCDALAADQVLMISLNAGSIVECYVGELNTGDGTFVAYPISEFGSQTPTLIGGTVTDSSMGGTFTIEFGTKPSSFPDNGSYVRFIR